MSGSELSFGIDQVNTETQNAGSNCKWQVIILLGIIDQHAARKPAGGPAGLMGERILPQFATASRGMRAKAAVPPGSC